MKKCWNYCTTSNSATNAQENEKEISNNLMCLFTFCGKKHRHYSKNKDMRFFHLEELEEFKQKSLAK